MQPSFRPTPPTSSPTPSRRAFLIAVVLVVLMILSLVSYRFVDRMTTERLVIDGYAQTAQARQAAHSGIDFLLAWMTDPEFDPALLATMPPEEYAWQIVSTRQPTLPDPDQLVCLFVNREQSLDNGDLVFGISSEGGKLDLNGFVQLDVPPEDQRELLLFLPGMTDTLADTLLDFIDADDIPREFGTESDSAAYVVRNAPLTSLAELLVIPEVLPELLFGEDTNRNGLLDSVEDDGTLHPPFDNADGVLDIGWERWLTLGARESNLRVDGTPKINVNMDDLELLEQELTNEFDEQVAEFVVAYRTFGPSDPAAAEQIPGGNSPQTANFVPGGQGRATLTIAPGPGGFSGGGAQSGGGGNSAAQFRIRSLYELIDARVVAEDPPNDVDVTSPWTSSDLSFLPQMEEALTIDDAETRQGRIDINYAPYELLSGLPEVPTALVEEIAAGAGSWLSVGDLLAKGVVDIQTLRRYEPFLTTRSRTYRVTAIGLWQSRGPIVRLDAVIDTAGPTPLILSLRDLSDLGPGYVRSQLFPEQSGLFRPGEISRPGF